MSTQVLFSLLLGRDADGGVSLGPRLGSSVATAHSTCELLSLSEFLVCRQWL